MVMVTIMSICVVVVLGMVMSSGVNMIGVTNIVSIMRIAMRVFVGM